MNIDLGDELSRLARSVHDDATADRMTGQVHTMVGRIRRRRAARHAATGVVGVGAVAAVALGGAQLAGRTVTPPATSPPATTAPTPPVTPTPTPTPTAEVPSPEPTTDPEPTAGSPQERLDSMVASPVDNPGLLFPVCGTVAAEALDDGMPPLELDLTESSLTLASGSTTETTVRLHTTEGLYALGNASPVGTLAVIKDGVVVGYQWLDPEGLVDVDLSFGQMLDFRALGTATFCGTGEGGTGDAVPLPAGEYDVIAALDVMVKEVGTPGGEADGQTYTMTAVSEPGTLTITED